MWCTDHVVSFRCVFVAQRPIPLMGGDLTFNEAICGSIPRWVNLVRSSNGTGRDVLNVKIRVRSSYESYGRVGEPGVPATLSRWRSRVQISSRSLMSIKLLLDYKMSFLPPRWEDEYHGTNDIVELTEMFRKRLYSKSEKEKQDASSSRTSKAG